MLRDNRINFNGQTLFKVMVGESYTVGDYATSPSPTGLSSGISPVTTFDAKRDAVGGALFASFSDTAGPTFAGDLHVVIKPADVIAVSAVASGVATVTINGETVASITTTAVGGVLGFWA